MKSKIQKWMLRLTVTVALLIAILLVIITNPSLLYANKTVYGNYTVYHNSILNNNIKTNIEEATALVKQSELYNRNLKLDICLNDGSFYPRIIEKLRGQAFGWGFYNKIIIMGESNFKDNYTELNGCKYNFTQLLAHEEIHCFQMDKLGLWKSNPIANYPNWKWEGYPEYVARRNADQTDLHKNIERAYKSDKDSSDNFAIYFSDGTIAPKEYYHSWILVRYCMDIKKMSYAELLRDTATEENIRKQVLSWYK